MLAACSTKESPLAVTADAICGHGGCPPPCNTGCTPAAGCSALCTDTGRFGQPVVSCGAYDEALCLPVCQVRGTCSASDDCSTRCLDAFGGYPSTCGRTGRSCASACSVICSPALPCGTACVGGPTRDSCGEYVESGVLQCTPCSSCIALTHQACADGALLSSCDAQNAGVDPPPPPPTFLVTNLTQLIEALNGPEGANINVRGTIELGSARSLVLKSGVTLAGDRSRLGGGPLLQTDDSDLAEPVFIIRNPNVRITGLRLKGPNSSTESEHHGKGIQIAAVAEVEIDNCEIYGFPNAAIEVVELDIPPTIDPLNMNLFPRIHDNYIHHNRMDEEGYGVVVSHGAFALIEQNTFNNNRHSIASGGQPGSGYFSRKNYFLSQMDPERWGFYYGQHMDVHGTLDNGHGGIAGEYFEISHNTVLGAQNSFELIRAAFKTRGTPIFGVDFIGNIVEQHEEDAVAVYCGLTNPPCNPDIRRSQNEYAVNRSFEMAVGDFDGDGKSDVFQATGATWWVSWGGVTDWRFLNFPTERGIRQQTTGELGFADIDNDGKTDVLARHHGKIYFSSAGRGEPQELTDAPAVVMSEIRFGDFDGDHRTDMFITSEGEWLVWRASTGVFQHSQTSRLELSELRFGNFDATPGTDVIAITSGALSISSGATGGWSPINSDILGSLEGTVVADVNGDGHDDLTWSDGQDWYASYNAVTARHLLSSRALNAVRPLDAFLIGTFDNQPGADALFYLPYATNNGFEYDAHFGVSSGLRANFATFSREEMR